VAELFAAGQLQRKPVILSITGTPAVVEATIIYLRKWVVAHTDVENGASSVLGVEINLSCPNVSGSTSSNKAVAERHFHCQIKSNDTPSGYDGAAIAEYVKRIASANLAEASNAPRLTIGYVCMRFETIVLLCKADEPSTTSLKLPPYTYRDQFKALVTALQTAPAQSSAVSAHPIAYLASTNTLGCSLWFTDGDGHGDEKMVKSLPSTDDGASGQGYDGTGGLAGESLHPISLGKVALHTCKENHADSFVNFLYAR
jgi:dihydroorotate dehydrogenase